MAADALLDPNLPPELAAQQASVIRRRRLADAMLQRGMQPVQSSNPRAPVSWTQGLAQIVDAYMGAKEAKSAERAQADLGQRYQTGLADEVRRISAMRQGRPAVYDPQEVEQSADQGNTLPANVGGDPRAAVMAALTSQYPMVRKLGELDYSHMNKADEPYTLGPDQVRFNPDGTTQAIGLPKASPEKSFKVGDTRTIINGDQQIVQEYQADSTWKEIGKGPRFAAQVAPSVHAGPKVFPTEVIDPTDATRMLKVDAALYKGGGLGSPGVIGVSGKIGDVQKANMKRQIAMQGVGDTIQRARDILTGKGGQELPTQSGLGSFVDTAASFVGVTPKGAKSADQLRVAGGALVAKVPRFEGPQSDKDVAYYKEVAGRIGDAGLPIERRLAALDEVERIWGEFEAGKKYGFFAPSGPGAKATAPAGASAGVPTGVDPAVWAVMTPEEKALWAK